MTWLIDLFGKALQVDAFLRDGDIGGILLVDEIDQHLHPALQVRVFGELRRLLPRMQIIATTHSPLVALGADPADLVVLSRVDDHIEVSQSPRDYRGYTVEDMLTDQELFDAPVRSPEAQDQLDRYQELLGKGDERTPRETDELSDLASHMLVQPPSPAIASDLEEAIETIRQRLSS